MVSLQSNISLLLDEMRKALPLPGRPEGKYISCGLLRSVGDFQNNIAVYNPTSRFKHKLLLQHESGKKSGNPLFRGCHFLEKFPSKLLDKSSLHFQ